MKKSLCRGLGLWVCLAVQQWAGASGALAADTRDKPRQPVAHAQQAVRYTHVEGITEYRLPNGLSVLLAPDASRPTTTVNVTYRVGSRHENYGETGMAHLLEHLVFKGTPKLPGKTIVQEFARRGMRMNGTTFYDRTNYFETFSANDDNLDWALKMEADRMVNSFIAQRDLDTEMTVVRNEMESGENSPFQVLWQNMTATAYQWHNYGKSTIGARSDVENVRIENLQAFYRKYYQPDNAVLTVTGRFDEARTLALIERYFGAIPKPKRSLLPDYTREPAQDGAREVTVSRVGDAQLVGVMYHTPPGAHEDATHVELLSYILGDTPSGRLHKALVESQKAASVSEMAFVLKDPGYLVMLVKLGKAQSLQEARQLLVDTMEGLARQPITEDELQRAKRALLNDFESVQSDPAKFGIALSEAIATGDWRLHFLRRDRIEKATLADLQRVALNHFVASNRTVGLFVPVDAPVRAQMPAAPDMTALLAQYQGRQAVAQGEVFDPSPANIGQRTERSTLPSGLQMALLPKRTRGETVHGQVVLRIGSLDTLTGQDEAASAAALMLMRGTRQLSRQQIADRLDALQSKLSISAAGDQAVVASFESRREHLPALLGLLGELLRQPAWPVQEFEQLRSEWLTRIEEGRRQPDALARNALNRHLHPYPQQDVRRTKTFEESLSDVRALTLEQVRGFHERFYGAQSAQVAIVGDFDAARARQVLTETLGDWRSAVPYLRLPQGPEPVAATRMQIETPDKANAVYLAGMTFPLKDDDADAPALILASRVFGGGGLKNRIMDRLRQAEGISYSAAASLQLNPWDARSSFGVYAIFAPENRARIEAAVSEELQRWVNAGVTEQELSEARSGLLQALQIGRTQDASLASSWTSLMARGRDMGYVDAQEARLKSATLEQVNQAIRKHLNPAGLSQVLAGDFAKAARTGKP
jgi:zinc protease